VILTQNVPELSGTGHLGITLMKLELGPEDYAYMLPDHWILHERDQDNVFGSLHEYYVKRVVQIIVECGAKTVLEVGCGDGWASGQMADAGLDVVGIDWNKNAIGYASIRVPKARFFVADVRQKEFADRFPNQFDAIAVIEVIEHIPPDDCVSSLLILANILKEMVY
jgi:2-polyprenyl-3-methyl-5-hydroxy-6-metoxy-1,4-benzoquinol methylase